MYKCVIFDMDGTLVDSYEGIFNAYRWTMEQMRLPFTGDRLVRKAIGAPLPYVFERLCGMENEQVQQAVGYYRAYYGDKGKQECRVYEGMEETLKELKKAGCFLGVATLKKEGFAKEILETCGLLPYFDAVCGMDDADRLTKAELIERCRQAAGTSREETVLVGDSEFDALGAEQAGVAFLAVTYGFGFREPGSLETHCVLMRAENAREIAEKVTV